MNQPSDGDVMGLVAEWAAAERRGDPAALARLLTDDFVGVGPRGFVLTRDQWSQRYAPGDLHHDEFTIGETSVRRYGEAAVVVGIQSQRASYRGHDASGRFRATLILVGSDGAWRLAGIHLSPIAGA